MGVQRVEAASFVMSMSANGTVCLTLSSGTGTFEIYLTAEIWARLGKTAAWFDSNYDQRGIIERLATERDTALNMQRALGSDLRAMTERRNELIAQIEALQEDEPENVAEEVAELIAESRDEDDAVDDRLEPTTIET